jgi:hypothetical protein
MIHPGAEAAAVSARRIEFSTSSGTTDLIDAVGSKKISAAAPPGKGLAASWSVTWEIGKYS